MMFPLSPTERCVNKARVQIAAMVLNSIHCITLYLGNLMPYLYSLFYNTTRGSSFDIDPSWMYPNYLIFVVIGTLSTDVIKQKIGLRLTTAIGIIIYDTGLILTYFTIKRSVLASTVTFMCMGGFGTALLESGLIVYLANAFQEKVGRATSLTYSSAALGGAIINQVITTFINPDVKTPDSIKGHISFFSQRLIVDRVPGVFLLIGSISIGLHVIGFCLLMKEHKPRIAHVSLESRKHERQTIPDQTKSVSKFEISDRENESLIACSPSSEDREHCYTDEKMSHKGNNCSKLTEKTPREVLKSGEYFYLAIAIIADAFCLIVVANYYKLFGQLWISDDAFFAIIGSTLSFLSVIFNLGTGYLVDTMGVKKTLIFHLMTGTLCSCFWFFTAALNRYVFLVFVNILLCLFNTQQVIFTSAVIRYFGVTYLISNLGLIFAASLFGYFVSTPLISIILLNLGWFWLFFVMAVFCFIPLLLIVTRLPEH